MQLFQLLLLSILFTTTLAVSKCKSTYPTEAPVLIEDPVSEPATKAPESEPESEPVPDDIQTVTDEIKDLDQVVQENQDAAAQRGDLKEQLYLLTDDELIQVCILTAEAIYFVKNPEMLPEPTSESPQESGESDLDMDLAFLHSSELYNYIKGGERRHLRSEFGLGSLFTSLIGSIVNSATKGRHSTIIATISNSAGSLADILLGIFLPGFF